MLLKCQCCGFEREFSDGEKGEVEAFEAGWDAPPHFSGYTACNLCPAVCVLFPTVASHTRAHALWAKEGRPSEWTLAKCGTDEHLPAVGGQI